MCREGYRVIDDPRNSQGMLRCFLIAAHVGWQSFMEAYWRERTLLRAKKHARKVKLRIAVNNARRSGDR
jgi:hypothetical protein